MATIILAGGRGTRLYPLTMHHSKPAVAYGGRYRLIDVAISNSIHADFRQIFVIAQYLSAELQHYIGQTYRFDAFNPGSIDVLTPQVNEKGEKEWFEGTADAVRKNLPILLKSSAEFFLILSGDQLYNLDLKQMLLFAKSKKADLTIGATLVAAKEAKRMGLLKMDRQSRILDFVEKPETQKMFEKLRLNRTFYKHQKIPFPKKPSYLGSMGIYIFKREALVSLLHQDPREDFGYHLIHTAVRERKTAAYLYQGYWEDIGTVNSYYRANLALIGSGGHLNTYDQKKPIYARPTFLPGPKIKRTQINRSIICEGCIIEAEEITNCVIGLRSHIKRGSVIRDTVMMGNHFYMPPVYEGGIFQEDCWIGEDCLIEKAIIDEHVQIGHQVKLINKHHYKNHDSSPIYVRDGILIVTAGTKIPSGFEF